MGICGTIDHDAAICIADAKQNIRLTSAAHAKILGRSPSEVVGFRWTDWTSPDRVADAIEQQDAFWLNKRPYDILTCVVRSDGTSVPVLVRSSLISGDDGDLMFSEIRPLDAPKPQAGQDALRTASFVRDLTYDLARQAGHYRFRDLTNYLLTASASAERAVEILAKAANDLR